MTTISGDGIGQKIVHSAKNVIESTGVQIEWKEMIAGRCAVADFGHPVPNQFLDSIKRAHAALKGSITNAMGREFPGPKEYIRKSLGLYTNARFAKTFTG